jgi:uncharacterized protein YrzB (UPF0473 family)
MADQAADRSELQVLKQVYGENVELHAEDGTTQSFRILCELALNGKHYAVLQTEAMVQEDDIEVFQVIVDEDGEIDLETITDEDEWEQVAEAYDDVQFGSDDQP